MTEPTAAQDWVDALGAMQAIRKNRSANLGSHGYTFADLDAVLDEVRPILYSHRWCESQEWEPMDDGSWRCITVFDHASGAEKRKPGVSVVIGKKDPQAQGSALTYARRYSMLSALGLTTDDDDGHAARPQARAAVKPAEPKTAQERKLAAMFAMMRDKGVHGDERKEFISTVMGRHVESSKDLTLDELGQVLHALEALPDAEG